MSVTPADRRKFEIQHCLGAGGFGEVYLANMISAGGVRSEVALKILHAGLAPRGQAVERLRDEARLLGMYNHPSILRIHDLVLLEGRVTLVTEYVDGADLDRCTEGDHPLPLSAMLAVIGKIADALNTAYNRAGPDGTPMRLLHRDIKPANIRIGRHGEVKLLDFGIATAAGFNREAKTQDNAIIGSFPYMAPERFERKGDTTASDVYSLGCVLFESLTMERLNGDLEVREFFANAMSQEKHDLNIAQRLDTLTNPHPAVLDLLRSLLNYDPNQRPSVETLGMQCEDLAAQVGGMSVSRWCRGRQWFNDVVDEGALSGRVITEASFTRVHIPSLNSDGALNPPINVPSPSLAPPAQRVAPPVYIPEGETIIPVETAETASQRALPRPRFLIAAAATVFGLAATVGVLVIVGSLILSAGHSEPNLADASLSEATPNSGTVTAEDGELPTEGLDPSPAAAVADRKRIVTAPNDEAPTTMTVSAASTASCSNPKALESAAKRGTLSAAQQSCLHNVMRDGSQKLTDRAKFGRVLLVDHRARCDSSRNCVAFETEQRYYFEEIGRSDVDMLYSWSMYLYNKKGAGNDTLTWVDRTLERKSDWNGVDYIKRVDKMLEVGAKVSYQRFSEDDQNESLRKVARNRSIQWLNNRVQLGKTTAEALKLCSSTSGSDEVCQARMHDVKAEATIVLVSIPIGATVTVDGISVGDAPVAVSMSHGAHTVGMTGPKGTVEHSITVGVDDATRWTWRSGEDRWESSF